MISSTYLLRLKSNANAERFYVNDATCVCNWVWVSNYRCAKGIAGSVAHVAHDKFSNLLSFC